MKRKTALLLLALGIMVSVLAVPATALGWWDISDQEWAQYGLSTAQVQTVADGFQDGSFRPNVAVTRGQFTKMAVTGLGVGQYTPLVPTFSDVPRGHVFYPYVEGAYAAGLVSGLGGNKFGPDLPISRQQVASILARWLSARELQTRGFIMGSGGLQYTSLEAWYAAEGAAALARFADQASIAPVHKMNVAYLAARNIAQGTNGRFNPATNITRAQSAALIFRVRDTAQGFAPLPTVTAIDPNEGPAAGGTLVDIYGTNFTSDATVKFGTKAATDVTYISSTHLRAISPAGTANTTVQVSVTTSAGTSANTPADDFRYLPIGAPTVTDLEPSAGPAAGGTQVVITGTNFTSDATVKFGTKAATDVTVNSLTKITCKAPAGTAGTVVDVVVTTAQGTSSNTAADDYAYGAPTVTSISPTHGPAEGGTTVTINGTGFVKDVKVYFGTKAVSSSNITVNSPTKLTVVSPAGTAGQTVQVKVTNDAGASADTTADDFTYDPETPTITSLSKNAGGAAGGYSIYINGTNFPLDEDDVTVFFGANEAAVEDVVNSTKMKVEVPAGTNHTVVDVRVKTAQGISPNTQADDFAYGEPVLNSLTPNEGDKAGGNTMVIAGTGFTPDAVVYFAGTAVSSSKVTVNGPNQITVIVPSSTTTGAKSVTVKNDAGESNGLDYTYTSGVPYITSLSKNAGKPAGGETITITGGNFGTTGKPDVFFGSTQVDPDDVTRNSSTKLTVITPPGTNGETVDVSVTTGSGTSPDTPKDDFAYGKPTVTGLDPSIGDPAGGTVVTIYGTGFTYDVTVKFGTEAATVVSVSEDNDEIVAVAPAGTAGSTVDVRVTNDYGTSSIVDEDEFRYTADYLRPTVTNVNPKYGQAGNTVVITGTNFVGDVVVKFGTKTAAASVDSETQITATAPSGIADGKVEVTVKNGYGLTSSTSGTANDFYYDTTAPTVTVAKAAGQANPTNNPTITFTVTFSENVTGLDLSEVNTASSTAPVTGVALSGSGKTYTVTVTVSAGGDVCVSIPAGAAQDAAGNDNQASNTATVTYDSTAPTVTVEQATGQNDPTNSLPILFTVTFSEAITGLTTGDFTVGGTATGFEVTGVTKVSDTVYTVSVSGTSPTSGTVTLSLGADKVTDLAGNPNAASTSTDNEVTYNTP